MVPKTVNNVTRVSKDYQPLNSPNSQPNSQSQLKLSKHSIKLIQYFPELKNADEYVTEFSVQPPPLENKFKQFTPDSIKYQKPDFGFNDFMTFDEPLKNNGWRRFMDCVSLDPKNQRVQNYIDFIHHKKIAKIKLPSVTDAQQSTDERRHKLNMLRLFEQNKDKPKGQVIANKLSKTELKIGALFQGFQGIKRDFENEKSFISTFYKQRHPSEVTLHSINQTQVRSKFRESSLPKVSQLFERKQSVQHYTIQKSPVKKKLDLVSKLYLANRLMPKRLTCQIMNKQYSSSDWLRDQLICKMEEALQARTDPNTQQYKYGVQGLRLLIEKRLARIQPEIHFKILLNSQTHTEHQLLENQRLIDQIKTIFSDSPYTNKMHSFDQHQREKVDFQQQTSFEGEGEEYKFPIDKLKFHLELSRYLAKHSSDQ